MGMAKASTLTPSMPPTELRITGRAFEAFSETAATLAGSAIHGWKERGGKIVGYFCSMVPEEIFMAAGLLPFRMRATGSTGTELADVYLTRLNCTFPRNCLNLALEGEFEFLDGVVGVNSCDHVRRLYDVWKSKVPTAFLEFIVLPRQTGPDQIAWYADELRKLAKSLERHFAVRIDDDGLRTAIALANRTRQLQRQLYELRKRDNPPITGAETLVVMVAGTAMPKDEYNVLLRELVDELGTKDGTGSHRARLMITGGLLDNPAWVRTIEETGGLVVSDGSCFGTRLMWKDIDEEVEDPIEALARYYLADRPGCPRLCDTQEKRSGFVTDMCREFRCDGIIGEQMMFCDQWNVENYLLSSDLKKAGIPFLRLEREYITSATGQLRTRVQAFIESMGK
jgi:bcr-type benzoyl-CoA reductase subunit C